MNEIFFKKALDVMEDSLCILNNAMQVLYCNSSFSNRFNTDKSRILSYDDLPAKYKAVSLLTELSRSRGSITRQSETSGGIGASVTATTLTDEAGNIIGYMERIRFDAVPSRHESSAAASGSSDAGSFDDIVMSDKMMFDINQTISRIAYFDSTILIQGESGTGKTALARHIHKHSNRADKPFVTINCGSIPENLIESELFGYASGAFTSASKKGKPGQVELADGGTLFLDEIGLLPYNLQSKFLQLIQEKTYTPVGALKSKHVDVRIISATNENLKEFIKENKFREDLYYRLRVIELFMPPLRERVDAIEPLAKYFLDKYNAKFGTCKSITAAAIGALRDYNWPGNIRELQYVMERTIITSDGDTITTEDIPPLHDSEPPKPGPESGSSITIEESIDFDTAVAQFEKELLAKVYKNNRSSYKVASALGLTQTKASRLLRKYNIP